MEAHPFLSSDIVDEDSVELVNFLRLVQTTGPELTEDSQEPESEDADGPAEPEDEPTEEPDDTDDLKLADLLQPGSGDMEPLNLYFREIAKHPLLTAEQEKELAKKIEIGRAAQKALDLVSDLSSKEAQEYLESDGVPYPELKQLAQEGLAARKQFIDSNLRFVVKKAKAYRGSELNFLDIIQDGNIGLIRAVDKFDFRRGRRFTTYAAFWIKQSIENRGVSKIQTIKIPKDRFGQVKILFRTRQEFYTAHGRPPTNAEILELTNLTESDIELLDDAMAVQPVSLNSPVVDHDGGQAELGDFLGVVSTRDGFSPDSQADIVHAKDRRAGLYSALSSLPEEERRLIELRFGLGRPALSLADIGKTMKLRREPVREKLEDTLAKLANKHYLRDSLFDPENEKIVEKEQPTSPPTRVQIKVQGRLVSLTQGNYKVMKCMSPGKEYGHIASELNMHISTAKSHGEKVCKALGVRTKAEAAEILQAGYEEIAA